MDNNNTQLIITVISNKNAHYIISTVITIAFILGIGIGMLIQFFLSKLSIAKGHPLIFTISVIAFTIAILQAFGQWEHITNLFYYLFK